MDEKRYKDLLVRRYLDNALASNELDAFFFLLQRGDLDDNLNETLDERIDLLVAMNTAKRMKMRFLIRLVAASLFLAIASTSVFFLFIKSPPPTASAPATPKNNSTDSTSRVLLTLANGSVIGLDSQHNGRVANQGQTTISKIDANQLAYSPAKKSSASFGFNMVSTLNGRQYAVILPDGSHAWLNAASSLRFPTAFTGNRREVTITGEAYFEIMHDPQHPFVVRCANTSIAALGTAFNVNAYNDEPNIQTTLLEGAVKVSVTNGQSTILTSGKQAQVTPQGKLTSTHLADATRAIAWKLGKFQFDKETLPAIMRQIARWYDVEIQFERPAPPGRYYVVTVPRNTPLASLLSILEKTGGVHFEIEGKVVTVIPD